MVFLLKDIEEGTVDAVIIAENSTAEEIQSAINKVKEEKSGSYQWSDLISALPVGCKVISAFGNNLKNVWY